MLVWQLRERLAVQSGTTLLRSEHVLLAVGSVPDPVNEQIGDIERHKRPARPAVLGRVVIGQVDYAVAVRQGHASEVPKDEHEAPFLVIHVPVRVISVLTGFDLVWFGYVQAEA